MRVVRLGEIGDSYFTLLQLYQIVCQFFQISTTLTDLSSVVIDNTCGMGVISVDK